MGASGTQRITMQQICFLKQHGVLAPSRVHPFLAGLLGKILRFGRERHSTILRICYGTGVGKLQRWLFRTHALKPASYPARYV